MLLLFGVACNRSDRPDSRTVKQATAPERALDSPLAGQPVTVSVASIAEVEAFIADQRGKVVVVDLWALW